MKLKLDNNDFVICLSFHETENANSDIYVILRRSLWIKKLLF